MPKTTAADPLPGYAPVAERIRLFYERYPEGRIVTHLRRRTADEVIFEAAVFRGTGDALPAATGWACEREGDGEINLVACLENTETSAIGRALANLGFTASAQRPSAEEMAKASRARARLARAEAAPSPGAAGRRVAERPREVRLVVEPSAQRPRATIDSPDARLHGQAGRPTVHPELLALEDLLALVRRCEQLALVRPLRTRRWLRALDAELHDPRDLVRWERRLRLWMREAELDRLAGR